MNIKATSFTKICFFTLVFCSVLVITLDVNANDLFTPRVATPEAKIKENITKPEIFHNTNNLIKKTGSFEFADGEILYVEGIVTDAFGVPVTGAVVKIWQANSAGKYHNLLESDSEYIDPNFNMSGTAVTNNLGEYMFITVFPGFYEERAPHINMSVAHSEIGEVETAVYFEKHAMNDKDIYYLAYTPEEREMVTCVVNNYDNNDLSKGKICSFDVTLNGVHKYKTY